VNPTEVPPIVRVLLALTCPSSPARSGHYAGSHEANFFDAPSRAQNPKASINSLGLKPFLGRNRRGKRGRQQRKDAHLFAIESETARRAPFLSEFREQSAVPKHEARLGKSHFTMKGVA
jgi:hypothetical protein